MIEHDEDNAALTRLLAGLGARRPEPHFEERVLQGIAARHAGRRSYRPKRFLWTGLGTLAAAGLCLIFLLAWRQPAPHTAARVPAQATVSEPAAPAISQTHAHPRKFAVVRSTPLPPPEPTQPALASFPAPEAPLNAQEKLLLRLAHHDSPVELAVLTPASLAAEQARRRIEFQEFFKPPDPLPDLTAAPADPQPEPTKAGDSR